MFKVDVRAGSIKKPESKMKLLTILIVCSLMIGCEQPELVKLSNEFDAIDSIGLSIDIQDRAVRLLEYGALLASAKARKDSVLAICAERGHLVVGLDTSRIKIIDYPDSTCRMRIRQATCKRCKYLTSINHYDSRGDLYYIEYQNVIADSIAWLETIWRRPVLAVMPVDTLYQKDMFQLAEQWRAKMECKDD